MTSGRYLNSQRGYSIVEMLVSVGLAAVLMAVAVPYFPAFWAEFQIGGAAREIAIDLQRARMRAVGENAWYRVVFDSSSGSYHFESSPDGNTFTQTGSTIWLPRGISFSGDAQRPTFDRLGKLTNSNGFANVTIANTMNRTKTVQINLLGKISIS